MNRENLLELNEEETRYFVEDEVNEVPPSDIIAFNELRSCADLLRINRNTLRKKITDLDIRVTRRRKLM